MNKQERIKELDQLIAKAQAERDQLTKEKALWVPEGDHWLVRPEGYVSEGCMNMDERAEFGHAAPDQQKAEQLRDFFAELVPKHPVPEVGQEFWVIVGSGLDHFVRLKWKGVAGDYADYNTGRTWDHEPTPEEVERKRKALAFDSSWRWV